MELRHAEERHRDGSARIVPVIVEPVFWKTHPLFKYQALPEGGKDVATQPNRGEAFVQVVQGTMTSSRASDRHRGLLPLVTKPRSSLGIGIA